MRCRNLPSDLAGVRLRVVSRERPAPDVAPAVPGLEDAYLLALHTRRKETRP